MTLSPIGGLANRMRAILAAAALAHDNGCALRIVWTRGSELNARFSELFDTHILVEGLRKSFGIDVTMVEAGFVDKLLLTPPLKRNLYITRLYQSAKFSKSLFDWQLESLISHPDELRNMTQGRSVFIASGLSFYSFPEQLYGDCFVPQMDLCDKVRARMSQLRRPVVGVHIRRTDNAMSIKHSPLALFVENMRRMDAETATFLVATDDEKVKATLRREFPGKVFTAENSAARDDLQGMKDAVVDMFSLVAADRFLGSYYSSFSDVVVVLRGNGCILNAELER